MHISPKYRTSRIQGLRNVALALAATVLLLIALGTREQTKNEQRLSDRKAFCNRGVKRGFTKDGFLWEKPCGVKARAIMFLAHGCNHQMEDWWPRDKIACTNCIGSPEERAIVEVALKKQLIVVAASSQQGKCWSPTDSARVTRILQSVQSKEKVPVIAFGASSGGQFVSSILPSVMPVCGFISQIMASPVKQAPPAGAVWIAVAPALCQTRRGDGRHCCSPGPGN